MNVDLLGAKNDGDDLFRSAAARHQEIRWRWHHEHAKRKQLSTRDIHSLLRSVLPDDGVT
jgi:hypothetical protein